MRTCANGVLTAQTPTWLHATVKERLQPNKTNHAPGIIRFLQHLPADMDEHALFSAIEDILISSDELARTRRVIEDPEGAAASDCTLA